MMYMMRFILGIMLTCLLTNGVRSQLADPSFTTSCGNSSLLTNAWRYAGMCQVILSSWYRDTITPFYYYRDMDTPLEYQNTTAYWGDICRWSRGVGECYENVLPQCQAGIGLELLNNPKFAPLEPVYCEGNGRTDSSLQAFYRRTCQGTTVKPDIQQRINNVNFDANTTCLNETHHREMSLCLESLNEELSYNSARLYQESSALRNSINRFATAAVNCMFSAINRSPCNQATKSVMYHVAKLQLPSFIDETKLDVDETTTADFSSIIRCTVGVYGDPHLKLCEGEGLVTCSALGQQTYLKNDWFTVTGNNMRIGVRSTNPPVTSMRSIKITFHSLDTGMNVASYTASGPRLPTVFDNTNGTTLGQGIDTVTLSLSRYGQVMFNQESTGMVLNLRQWSGNYFFTLRVAQSVIQKSHGLLASGCPASQIISRSSLFRRQAALRRKRATQDQCETQCNNTVADASFREICKFDCFALDNVEGGTNMTASAEEDIKIVLEMDEEIIAKAITPKPTTPSPTTKNPNSAPQNHLSYSMILTAVFGLIAFKMFGATN